MENNKTARHVIIGLVVAGIGIIIVNNHYSDFTEAAELATVFGFAYSFMAFLILKLKLFHYAKSIFISRTKGSTKRKENELRKELLDYKNLLDQKLITQDEFELKSSEIKRQLF